MTEVIDLNNNRNSYYWTYMFKTFVNICGRCGKQQLKFQSMENKLMEEEKKRMEMFLYSNFDEKTYFDLKELKEHLRILPPNERHKVKDFERLRNIANGMKPNEGLKEIDKVIRELEEDEREREEEIERRIEDNTFDPYDIMSPKSREEYDKWNEEGYKASLEDDED